ncbi:hypothetical protein EDC01DRAFT_630114 [Geopyxis carbonaria]|nr:hypothetical protein EDC01DRAFT_630114 [Geopyxis carbonaria]
MPLASSVPSTSVALLDVYSNVLQTLFLPSSSDFVQPLLDTFVASQDKLIEDNTLFTSSMRIRETGVLVDGVIREFRRCEEGPKQQPPDQISLDQLRKLRLRLRLQSQAASRSESTTVSKEDILRKSKERKEAFDAKMNREEEEALKGFKEGLRKAVVM